jgi:hypothetical protein
MCGRLTFQYAGRLTFRAWGGKGKNVLILGKKRHKKTPAQQFAKQVFFVFQGS